jgi:methylmalonyl-CoA mutase N-terminal domain/subunit
VTGAGRRQALERWEREVLQPHLERFGERQEQFLTTWGDPVPRVALPPAGDPGELPGAPPFGRGIHPTMYRGRLWTMRQYAGFGTCEETNLRYRHLLERGQTGLSVAFDLPTQMGYDSDHAMAEGEVGKVGVAVDTVEDLAILFDGIPLDQVTTSMTINSTAAILLAMVQVLAEERGLDPRRLGGTVQNDPLKEYMARGTYIYPPEPSLRLTTDLIAYCTTELPRWNPISISGYHIREAGATAAQELGFTLANGIEYVQRVVDRGLEAEGFAGRLSFFFNAHNNLLEEVAKFRAARRLWYRIMSGFGVQSPRAAMLRFHVQTAGSTLTAQQPECNTVRVAYQALAAVLGGAQSLHTNAQDEALNLPTEATATLALRTQQIVAHETGVAETVDPLGGSHLVEHWTSQLEARAQEYLDAIAEQGGVVAALRAGYQTREIQEAAYRHQRAVEAGERVVVGVNRFVDEGAPTRSEGEAPRPDPALAARQGERLAAVRSSRDQAALQVALDAVRTAAREADVNLVPPIREAVRARASVGEISDTLREVFGVHRP